MTVIIAPCPQRSLKYLPLRSYNFAAFNKSQSNSPKKWLADAYSYSRDYFKKSANPIDLDVDPQEENHGEFVDTHPPSGASPSSSAQQGDQPQQEAYLELLDILTSGGQRSASVMTAAPSSSVYVERCNSTKNVATETSAFIPDAPNLPYYGATSSSLLLSSSNTSLSPITSVPAFDITSTPLPLVSNVSLQQDSDSTVTRYHITKAVPTPIRRAQNPLACDSIFGASDPEQFDVEGDNVSDAAGVKFSNIANEEANTDTPVSIRSSASHNDPEVNQCNMNTFPRRYLSRQPRARRPSVSSFHPHLRRRKDNPGVSSSSIEIPYKQTRHLWNPIRSGLQLDSEPRTNGADKSFGSGSVRARSFSCGDRPVRSVLLV